ncbi:PfkB family carbohydrate kinase [Kribbella sp. NBC_00662]|uniref:PfkB family carbohydrate kinase n=1 Tax=Kribbella sp. NBC_00662 TaxID=2975969 RepID=UPI00324F8C57
MTTVVGVRGGLSVDHLVDAGLGTRFDELGGPGLFGALGARLVAGTQVQLYARLPDDEPRFAKVFQELGIDTSETMREPQAMRLWILNSPQGRRILATSPSGSVEIEGTGTTEPDGDTGAGDSGEVPVTGGIDGLLDSSPTERAAVAESVRVGVDPHQLPLQAEGPEYLLRVSPSGALVLPSRVQLQLIDPDPLAAARAIRARLGFDVIARLDREGMVVISDSEWFVRDTDVRVVETTGAGDSSAGAIVAAWTAGADLATAAAYGVSVARLALSDWGHAGLLADPLTEPFPSITITRRQ